MYEFLIGTFAQITPTHVIVNVGGVGYILNISLNTYESIKNLKEGKILVHFSISENNQSFYGFFDENERTLFRHLVSVSGVGPSTARMILSSQTSKELISAIIHGNISLLKSVKGIGPKTAQRIIVELQDKLGKMNTSEIASIPNTENIQTDQAIQALEALGFNKTQASKAIGTIFRANPTFQVEELIKHALRIL
jgi:holliday junction DNA helicase RuvA